MDNAQQSATAEKVHSSLFFRDEEFGVGGISFDLFIDESHLLEFGASDHPIESSAVITDHITRKLRTCTVTGLFSNRSIRGKSEEELEVQETQNQDPETQDPEQASEQTQAQNQRYNRALEMYEKLEALAEKREAVRLVTSLKVYPEMVILSLSAKRGPKDGETITFTMKLREFSYDSLKQKEEVAEVSQPEDMESEENRLVAEKQTNGKVSAKRNSFMENYLTFAEEEE